MIGRAGVNYGAEQEHVAERELARVTRINSLDVLLLQSFLFLIPGVMFPAALWSRVCSKEFHQFCDTISRLRTCTSMLRSTVTL